MNNRSFCNCRGTRNSQKKASAILKVSEGHVYCIRCEECGLRYLCEACQHRAEQIANNRR